MIEKIYLNPDPELPPVIMVWDNEADDYIFEQIPKNISRSALINLVEEVKRITKW